MEDTQVVETLKPMIDPRRIERIEAALEGRTYSLTVVLETLYDEGNMAAIMRTCEGLGIQRVNMLSIGAFKSERRITQGSHKWLDVYQYVDPITCMRDLRAEGYRIVATHLEASRPIHEIDFTQKTAIIFGNEKEGVSSHLLEHVDARMSIPMSGFVQSFNVSVAAGLTLYHALSERRRALGQVGDLTEEEKQRLRARFYRRSVRRSDVILKRVLS
ncbi:MAG: RNA methyltransferase [Myxococcota bacterium]